MKILIKQFDTFKSIKNKNKFVNEYLIYLKNDTVLTKCYIVLGDEAKKEKVNEILFENFITEDWTENSIVLSEIIEEIKN